MDDDRRSDRINQLKNCTGYIVLLRVHYKYKIYNLEVDLFFCFFIKHELKSLSS